MADVQKIWDGGGTRPLKVFAHFGYKAARVFGRLKMSLSKSTSGAHQEIANCVALLFNRLTSIRESISVKSSASALRASTTAAGTALLTLAGPSYTEGPQ